MTGWADRAGNLRRAPRVPGSRAVATSVQVEFAVSVCMASLRIGVVIQMLPAVATGFEVSPRPVGYLVCWGLAVAASLAVSVVSLARRRPLPTAAISADIGLGVLLVIGSRSTVPVTERMGSWIGWTGGYALAVAMTSGPLRSFRGWLLGLAVIIAGYLAYILPVAAHTLPTVIGNVLGYLVIAGTVRLVIDFVRRISREADEARAEVARMARREEEHRAQLAFHDATTVMQLLADPALPAVLRAELQTQADVEVRRMRSYLRGDAADTTGLAVGTTSPVRLDAAITTATEGFGDLALQTRLAPVSGLIVDGGAGAALVAALRTVLHNVRTHAAATTVLVRAEIVGCAEPGVRRWAVSVVDDGCGFDPDTTELGIGLRSQVIDELGRHGIHCTLMSKPGRGTRVDVSGSARC